eukprot:TRINITY_DN123016_c0_g1_i1.p1 TRINITY_DN123016_c0_g1~~TRINITY_DN123016_c0_g1_i1.p1  ORF type:complete len:155 (-),score=32.11 TRINITY_DN123016_c0_g1_i1:142-606(-)
MYVVSLCAVLILAVVVGTAHGVVVNADCSKDACGSDMTCQDNKCKRIMGAACASGDQCVTNAQCSTLLCSCNGAFINIGNTTCAYLVHHRCISGTECVPHADCVDVINNGGTSKQCQCKGGHTWSVDNMQCNAAPGLAASLLLVAAIFVTSHLL